MTTYDSMSFMVARYDLKEKAMSFFNICFLIINNKNNVKIFYITFMYKFNVIHISMIFLKL